MGLVRLRREGLVWHEVGGEVILLDLESSVYFIAKGSGSLLISSLTEGISEQTLLERVLAHYETDEETARADIAEFLKQLDDQHMLEHVE
jgi:hypothetical protein